VNIVKIDADGDGKDIGKKYGVSGFPSASNFFHLFNLYDRLMLRPCSPQMVLERGRL